MAKAPRYDGLTSNSKIDEAAGTILRALFDAVLAPAPAVLRSDDGRAVHDMRVAIRRLRTAMRTFSDRYPRKRWRTFRRATRRIGRKLGDVRDADVHVAALHAALTTATQSERVGIDYAIQTLLTQRSETLADFAVEWSQFDRDALVRAIARG